jgi:hypothetical protein
MSDEREAVSDSKNCGRTLSLAGLVRYCGPDRRTLLDWGALTASLSVSAACRDIFHLSIRSRGNVTAKLPAILG